MAEQPVSTSDGGGASAGAWRVRGPDPLARIEVCLREAAQHASRALLGLEDLRGSDEPTHRQTYREVHDLVGALAGAHVLLGTLQESPEPRPDPR